MRIHTCMFWNRLLLKGTFMFVYRPSTVRMCTILYIKSNYVFQKRIYSKFVVSGSHLIVTYSYFMTCMC